jgi:hypothetical protein
MWITKFGKKLVDVIILYNYLIELIRSRKAIKVRAQVR